MIIKLRNLLLASCIIVPSAATEEDAVSAELQVETLLHQDQFEHGGGSISPPLLRSRQLAPDWCSSIAVDVTDYTSDGRYYVDVRWDCDAFNSKWYDFCFKKASQYWMPICQDERLSTPHIGWPDEDPNGMCTTSDFFDLSFSSCETQYKMKVWKRRQLFPSACEKTFYTGRCGCTNPCPHGGQLVGDRVTGTCGWYAPSGTEAFIYADNRYYKANYEDPVCPPWGANVALVDGGKKCLVGTAPSGHAAWKYKGGWYYTPNSPGECPYRPYPESRFDGRNCFIKKFPDGYVGFVEDGKYYTHPKHICPMSGSHYDGANCFVDDIPTGVQMNVFQSRNGWYYNACPN